MAKVHGKDLFVSLGGKDLSSYGDKAETERTGDKHDVTTFGNTAHRYLGGLLDGTTTLEGFYDNTLVNGPAAAIIPLIGTVVPLIRRPEGTGSGKPQTTVDVLVEKYKESIPVADYIRFTCDIQYAGPVVPAVQ